MFRAGFDKQFLHDPAGEAQRARRITFDAVENDKA